MFCSSLHAAVSSVRLDVDEPDMMSSSRRFLLLVLLVLLVQAPSVRSRPSSEDADAGEI